DVTTALEAITRRSQGLLRFVERYRRIADLPEPHLQLEPLLPLVQGVGRLVQPALEARAIALDVCVTPQDLAAPLDRELLEQALLNLLRNAADAAADRPQPRIGLECRRQGGQCVIDVIDN